MAKSRVASVFSESPLQLSAVERSEATRFSVPVASVVQCCRPLEMAFFFDGTRNNLKYDESLEKHSNVARLSQVFGADRRVGEIKDFRYRTYVPGVGTEFRDEVGDSGVGMHAVAGAAAGWGGRSADQLGVASVAE